MARYYSFSGAQQYELADTRAEIEGHLQPVELQLGATHFVPGQDIDFPLFTRPLRYAGAEPSASGKSYSLYFYSGNTAENEPTDLFGKPQGKEVHMVLHWISPTCFLKMGTERSGRDFNYIHGTWDWERGPGTALGGRHEWQKKKKV